MAMQIIRFVVYDKGGPVAEGAVWSDGDVALHWRGGKNTLFKSRAALESDIGRNHKIVYDRAV